MFKLKWLKLILIERNNPVELQYSDIIIAISKELGRDLEKLCNKKVITIYNPSFDKKIYKLAQKKN